jgi:hypothetical protein
MPSIFVTVAGVDVDVRYIEFSLIRVGGRIDNRESMSNIDQMIFIRSIG